MNPSTMFSPALTRLRPGYYETRDGRFTVRNTKPERRYAMGWEVVDTNGNRPFFSELKLPWIRKHRHSVNVCYVDTLGDAGRLLSHVTAEEMTSQRLVLVFDRDRKLIKEQLCDTPMLAQAFADKHRPQYGASYVILPKRPRRKDGMLKANQPSLSLFLSKGLHT